MQQGIITVLLTGILALLIGQTAMWLAVLDRDAVHDLFWICVGYAVSVPICSLVVALIQRERGYPVNYAWGALSLLGVGIVLAQTPSAAQQHATRRRTIVDEDEEDRA